MSNHEEQSMPVYHQHMKIPWLDFVTSDNVTLASG